MHHLDARQITINGAGNRRPGKSPNYIATSRVPSMRRHIGREGTAGLFWACSGSRLSLKVMQANREASQTYDPLVYRD